MIDKVVIVGRLGKDPEEKQSGIVSLAVATNTRWRDRDGEWKDKTTWHNVSCFGHTATYALKYLRKGNLVGIDGRHSSGKTKSGDFFYNVTAIDLKCISSAPAKQEKEPRRAKRQEPEQWEKSDHSGNEGNADDDLPF